MDSVARTKRWLEDIVIGLSLCPFAAKVFLENRILYVPTNFTASQESMVIIQEAIGKILNPEFASSTCLIIFETGLESFDDYLDLYYALEEQVLNGHVKHEIQFASFHPNYQFEGTQTSDPENYTNRSPYPMIHLLRVDDVTTAIESHPDINSVPLRNIELMKEFGLGKIQSLYKI